MKIPSPSTAAAISALFLFFAPLILQTLAAWVRPAVVLPGRGSVAREKGALIFGSDDMVFARRDQSDLFGACVVVELGA